MPVHHRLRFLTFPMRASRLCSLWPDMRPLRFRRAPFGRDGTLDPGGATASRIVMPHMLPSTVPSVSASAKFFLSWLNPPPLEITVYASHPPSPTTAQHSLPGGALPPYRGRSFTGRIASASPDAPELKFESIPLQRRVCKPSVPQRRKKASKWPCSSCSFTNGSAGRWPTAALTTAPTPVTSQQASSKPPTIAPIKPFNKSLTCSPPDYLSNSSTLLLYDPRG